MILSANYTEIYSPSIITLNVTVTADYTFSADYYKWYFDYANYPTTFTSSTTPTITHEYTGYYNQKYTVLVECVPLTGTTLLSSYNPDYITILGPYDNNRYGLKRNLDLVDFLPMYQQGGEIQTFIEAFQEYLNEMFVGDEGWITSSTNLPITQNWSVTNSGTSAVVDLDFSYTISGVSATTDSTEANKIDIYYPSSNYDNLETHYISLIEKINRLPDLLNPSIMDVEYLPYYASNLGYDVSINRYEIGVSGVTNPKTSATDINKYIRFAVENIPTWYKIKTTENSIRILLYSYGLVGELSQYYTDSYRSKNDGGLWKSDYNGLDNINKQWFPTPHFGIYIDYDQSADISFEIGKRYKIVNAIESIRPANTVFERLIGYVARQDTMDIAGFVRFHRYKIIIADGYANDGGTYT